MAGSFQVKWRHRDEALRAVVIFTDATYHGEMSIEEARGGTWEDVAMAVEQERVFLSLFASDFPCYDTLSTIDRCVWEPIAFDPDEKGGAIQGLRDFTSAASLQRINNRRRGDLLACQFGSRSNDHFRPRHRLPHRRDGQYAAVHRRPEAEHREEHGNG